MSMSDFNGMPKDARYLYVGSKLWPRRALQYLWGDWTAILPWPWAVALWNWTWNLKGDDRVKA